MQFRRFRIRGRFTFRILEEDDVDWGFGWDPKAGIDLILTGYWLQCPFPGSKNRENSLPRMASGA